ncbi:MAG: deoxyribose-phosphate aldolase [Crocinitomicaceae bacterium]|nr:deoxyribose-phosphate aldolase [Crocinitomicaceae bacterium]
MTKESIHQLISFIDLTSLNDTDNQEAVAALVDKANKGILGSTPAAVCVFPNFGQYARSLTKLNVAVVGGCFPTGQTTTEAKIAELQDIATLPVDEVDIVINRGELIAGNYDYVANEISLSKKAIGSKHLKVILESGQLNEWQIKKASEIAIDNGADFIKTSTGKINVGATVPAARIMCEAIARSGKKVGFKASGGIRTYEDAMNYYRIVHEVLGENWLTPELFRIGASSLFDNLEIELQML